MSVPHEYLKHGKNNEDMSQVISVTALAETEQRREQARSFPLRLLAPLLRLGQCSYEVYLTHMFVTALAETEQRREQARTFPLRLRGGNDNHTSSQRKRSGKVLDRKSTRLNSSHTVISYAVFCLKKKKKRNRTERLCAAVTYLWIRLDR